MTGLKVPNSLKRAVIFLSDGTGRQTCIAEDKGKTDVQLRKAIAAARKAMMRSLDSRQPKRSSIKATVALCLIAVSLSAGSQLNITTDGPLPSCKAGAPYIIVVKAAGGTPPYRWTYDDSLPRSLALRENTGVLVGTCPLTPDTYEITVRVSDSSGYPDGSLNSQAEREFVLEVK